MKLFLSSLLLPLFFLSCQQSPLPEEVYTVTGNAMTIDYRILVGHPLDKKQRATVHGLIQSAFDDIDLTCNNWNPSSEISAFNKAPAGQKCALSPLLYDLMELSQNVVALTRGRFDPAIGGLQNLWRKHMEEGLSPPQEAIAHYQRCSRWDNVHLAAGVAHKDYDETYIDLGGIAKGYCVDLILQRLNEAGYANVFVDWGGDIACSGQHPQQRPWTVVIRNPFTSDPLENPIATLSLSQHAVATSGDYWQQWQVQEEGRSVSYTHILDPKTQTPLTQQGITSVSVLAPSCALADAFATAGMIFDSPEEARHWAEEVQQQFPDMAFWIVSREEI